MSDAAPGRHVLKTSEVRKAIMLPYQAFNVVLTTYELVMRDRPRLKRWRYAYIIIDEGHRMKNSASKLSEHINDGLIQ